jgi:hypothetical protein
LRTTVLSNFGAHLNIIILIPKRRRGGSMMCAHHRAASSLNLIMSVSNAKNLAGRRSSFREKLNSFRTPEKEGINHQRSQFLAKTLTSSIYKRKQNVPRQLHWKIHSGYEQNGKCLFDAEAQ